MFTYPVDESCFLPDVPLRFTKGVACFDLEESGAFVLVAKTPLESDEDSLGVQPVKR